jgi:hypothetical protein
MVTEKRRAYLKEYLAKYRVEHKEEIAETQREYDATHVRHTLEQMRRQSDKRKAQRHAEGRAKVVRASMTLEEWRAKLAARVKEYARLNPEKIAEKDARRRARESNTLCTLTKSEIREMKAAGCMFCGSGEDLVIAHDTPVSKGGHTTRGNTFCLCATCNRQMSAKDLQQTLKQKSFI